MPALLASRQFYNFITVHAVMRSALHFIVAVTGDTRQSHTAEMSGITAEGSTQSSL